jgi:branched-chain amino acid transport system ATP-binding protein
MDQLSMGRLVTEDLTKKFNGFVAVDEVDMTIEDGKVRSLIGPNGAGKTTFFNLVSGVLQPTHGEIIFDGTNITDEAAYVRPRLGISRTYQITNLYDEMTVAENLETAVGIHRHNHLDFLRPLRTNESISNGVEELLALLSLESERNHSVATLSHGDKRYLEIGVALASDPDLLLLDEPTSGMGPAGTQETMKLIKRLRDQCTILLVEHDLEVVMEVSDAITVLDSASVIADGDTESVRNDSTVQQAYLGGKNVS